MKLCLFSTFAALMFCFVVQVGAADPDGEKSRTLEVSRARIGEDGVHWYELQQLDVEGQAWSKTKAMYDRLPARAEGKVRAAVWNLSRHSAGLCARFVTDATSLHVRWTLTSASLAMPHMPATGVSGVDLYARTDAGKWRWLAVGQPRAQSNSARLAHGLPAGEREYLLYLPLYNGVSSVEIGLPKDAVLKKGKVRPKPRRKPLVFYGTSITQGGCASRPGMVHTAILGRWFDRPVINLGFSGNGKMENAVYDLMAEIDAAVFVIDCLPNMQAASVTERTADLVRTLRAAHAQVPILLVEDRNYAGSFLNESKRRRNLSNQAALRQEYDKLTKAGVKELYYLEGRHLLGEDGEDTVDSSHPTDLGFLRQAKAFRKVLQPLLEASEKPARAGGAGSRGADSK